MVGIEVALGATAEQPGLEASGVKRLVRPDVYDLVAEGLKSKGYDGLHHDGECGCEISDLAPCGEFYGSCKAGYKVVAPGEIESEYSYWICDSKNDRPWEV